MGCADYAARYEMHEIDTPTHNDDEERGRRFNEHVLDVDHSPTLDGEEQFRVSCLYIFFPVLDGRSI